MSSASIIRSLIILLASYISYSHGSIMSTTDISQSNGYIERTFHKYQRSKQSSDESKNEIVNGYKQTKNTLFNTEIQTEFTNHKPRQFHKRHLKTEDKLNIISNTFQNDSDHATPTSKVSNYKNDRAVYSTKELLIKTTESIITETVLETKTTNTETDDKNKSFSKNAVDESEIKNHGKYISGIAIGKVKPALRHIEEATSTSIPPRVCVHKYNAVAHSEKAEGTRSPMSKNYEYDGVEYEDFDEDPHEPSMGTLSDGTSAWLETCSEPSSYCYALWQHTENDTIEILGQGCWQSSGQSSVAGRRGCSHSDCRQDSSIIQLPTKRFCCCHGDHCNANPIPVWDAPSVGSSSPPPPVAVGGAPAMAGATLATLTVFCLLAAAALLCRRRCHTRDKAEQDSAIEKGDLEGKDSETTSSGMLCADNLALIEHIESGRYGSVWRGTLASRPVAVKIYSSSGLQHWTREVELYASPLIAHPNILQYYGWDTRGGTSQHLIVVELAGSTLRQHLQQTQLDWRQFATLAHSTAAALAHLHSHQVKDGLYKPCIVHRDINSNNILMRADGSACLADLGLALALPKKDRIDPNTATTTANRITEAGTLRYLAPEALEGALDLRDAEGALRAVDVFAVGLVLWEALWRVSGAHAPAPTPPYAPPYHAVLGLPAHPTLQQMQSAVSRHKVRPPLPRGTGGGGAGARALRLAVDTCEECWDQDAEARLSAVCVEERFAEMLTWLRPAAPRLTGNNQLGSPAHRRRIIDSAMMSSSPPSDNDKNSNCLWVGRQVDSPVFFPQPHQGRNPCQERNMATNTDPTQPLIDKSLKDTIVTEITSPKDEHSDANCWTVARNPHHRQMGDYGGTNQDLDRFTMEMPTSYQRPLDYVQNDVRGSDNDPSKIKQTNILQDVKIEKPKWALRNFFKQKTENRNDKLDTEVKLVANGTNNLRMSGKLKTSLVVNDLQKSVNVTNEVRPTNLCLNDRNALERNDMWLGYTNYENPCTLSPPNQTLSATMMIESELNKSSGNALNFKELPNKRNENDSLTSKTANQIFAVIVPKAKLTDFIDTSIGKNVSINPTEDKKSLNSLSESVRSSLSVQSLVRSGHSESDDSIPKKKRLSCDENIYSLGNVRNFCEGRNSRSPESVHENAQIEMKYINIDGKEHWYEKHNKDTEAIPFDLNSDCTSSSDDEQLLLLSEDGNCKITIETRTKANEQDNLTQNERIKNNPKDMTFTKSATDGLTNLYSKYAGKTRYANLLNETSDSGDGLTGDNPLYVAVQNGQLDVISLQDDDSVFLNSNGREFRFASISPTNQSISDTNTTENVVEKRRSKDRRTRSETNSISKDTNSPRTAPRHLSIRGELARQRSLEQFSSSGDLTGRLRNPAERVKTPGDVPAAVRRARRDKLAKGSQSVNRLSLYDDRMMFGNSL